MITSTDNVLHRELAYYQAHKSELLAQYRGQFVLIKGDGHIGTHATFWGAYEAGLRILGNVPMFIREVTDEDPAISLPTVFVISSPNGANLQ